MGSRMARMESGRLVCVDGEPLIECDSSFWLSVLGCGLCVEGEI